MRMTAGRRIKRELMKILDVLTGLIKPPGTCTGSSILFLATFIPFAVESIQLSAPRGGDGTEVGGHNVETSEWV